MGAKTNPVDPAIDVLSLPATLGLSELGKGTDGSGPFGTPIASTRCRYQRAQPRKWEERMAHSASAVSARIFVDRGSGEYWGGSEENMSLGYDIFRESGDGSPLWVAQAATLTEAKEKLEMLARSVPAQYFIRDAASAKIVARVGPDKSQGAET
jgi:hypothetical protein